MIYSTLTIPLLSLVSVALAVPGSHNVQDPWPYGAFPSSSASPSTLSTSAIPKPSSSSAAATPSTAPAAAQSPASTPSVGKAIIQNHCDTPVYVWSVGSTTPAPVEVSPGSEYSESYRLDHSSGGVALKVSTEEDGLYNSAPMTIFAYNLNGEQVWYDLSDVFGDAFKGHPVQLTPAEPAIYWADGVRPAGSQVRVQNASDDLTLTLC
ncbi:Uncharacterized protein PECH_008499 [Penicillium ucsense]|uniref:Bys1 family protein n=1 Tax=Penicillium ucsense TaxID=2839758 RepID=A0A8J8VZ12_9EURO|nr:Uncharacterized protein PECM_001658 [Penicillium ucsense]KAF7734106.1 Uncharacterized protein PECH_008499 [Penicillium ucsense]